MTMKITVSAEALKAAGGSTAVALQKAGVPMKGVNILADGTVTVMGRRSNPARGRASGAIKPKRGKGSYSRKAGKAVRS